MKILHSADWHLGRIFHAVHLTDDQACIMDQFIAIAKDVSPDIILVTGDIYDRAVPPVEAVKLLDDTMNRLISDVRKPLLIIAGNHDSPDRLGFGSQLFSSCGLYIAGAFTSTFKPIILEDQHGPVYFYSLPYAEPSVIRQCMEASCTDHNSAMDFLLQKIKSAHPQNYRSVLCAHAFTAGGSVSESERPLNVGGSGTVDLSFFDGFSFVALGHLHRSQWLNTSVHYAGSPMKYSFSESTHNKSVSLVELGKNGILKTELLPLTPRHDVRVIKGTLQQIFDDAPKSSGREDYLSIVVEDTVPILDLLGKLRSLYPNVLSIERPGFTFTSDTTVQSPDHRTLTDTELFAAFYEQTTGTSLDTKQSAVLSEIIEKLLAQEREARA